MIKHPFQYPTSSAKLRACQKMADEAIIKYFEGPKMGRSVIVQLPTGTGKTALIAIMPFSIAKQKVLILTPNVKLARDMADELDILNNRKENAYKKFEILSDEVLKEAELYVLRLESGADAGDIDEHHIIVSNFQQLHDVEKWFAGKQDSVDLIIIDEAHHQAADTYKQILDFFPMAKVVGLTATPFRSDGRPIEGEFIYKYSFNQAIRDGIIRNLRVVNVAPEQVELEFTDSDKKIYTLNEVLKMREESWFRRGIALSQDCCDSIARKALEKLNDLRTKFPNESHQIIAAAISKRHARENVKPAFEKLGLHVGLVSSAPEDKKTNEETFKKLKQNKLDVIIHIGMIGEGFNHPPLGVAAIFRPYQTLNPYIQFIGRVLRSNGTTPYSYIVSHLGLNQLQRFEEFKMFDYEDQEFLKELFSGKKRFSDGSEEVSFVETPANQNSEEREDNTPHIRELGESTINFESEFVAEEQVKNALTEFEKLNKQGREVFLKKLGIDPSKVDFNIEKKDVRLKPIDKRKASRNLLNEKEKSIATDVIKELGLQQYGRNFNKLFPNFTWVKRRVSKTFNEKMGIESNQRKSITNAMFEEMETRGLLSGVKQEIINYFRAKLK